MPDRPLLLTGRAPLVGRVSDQDALAACLLEARGGRASLVLLAGAPGIGKTRLLDEVAARAQREGTTVLRGSASQAEGMPPYLPFLEALV
jgi:predicted ATPase